MRIGIVGTGNIADRYAERIAAYDSLELVAATDLVPGRAEAFVARFGGSARSTLEELLASPAVDTVVNLTAPQAHAEVTRAALAAGKHVHSEKPLALTHAEARELVELARARGLRLSAAPTTLLGEAQQTLWKLVRDGAIGRVRVVYGEANWGRLESWHPDPRALYGVGPLVDVGIYPLTITTALFGPARRVTAYATTVEPDRALGTGDPFRPEGPDLVVAVVELESGVVLRLTASFYVPESQQRGLELHGDGGSLWLPTWGEANSRVLRKTREGGYELVPPLREPYPGIDWGSALDDLAAALEEDRPHRASAEHAAHVVEILEAAAASAAGGGPLAIASGFDSPQPLEWTR
jgi:predicted dehydrogenase